jgi:HlyD family secretion protein
MTAKNRSRVRQLLTLILAVGGAIALAVWYFARSGEAEPVFKTAALSRGDITQSVTANGQLNPVKSVQVGSQISGFVNEVRVDYNSTVKEGDIIAQIDPSSYERAVSQAQAELLSTQAALELAQLNHRRAKELRAGDLISASEYDSALVTLHQAEAAVKMREAAVERARVDLQRTTIYAPISGVVITRNIDVGQTVAASFNTPTLFLIANDLTRMQIEAMVSEADVGSVEEGQQVTFTVDAFPARQFTGAVRQVRYAPTTNQNVVTYITVVDVRNPDLKLRPGMTANVSIITAQRTNVLRVPNAALRFRPPTNALLATVPSPGSTNAAASATASDRLRGDAAPAQAVAADLPQPPWAAEGRPPSREEVQRWLERLTPEQREQMRQVRERMGGPGDPGRREGGGFAGGARRAAPDEGPATRTVYVPVKTNTLTGAETILAQAATIRTGIADATYTEVLEGLQETDIVLTGLETSAAFAAGTTPNPFRPFGGPPRPR